MRRLENRPRWETIDCVRRRRQIATTRLVAKLSGSDFKNIRFVLRETLGVRDELDPHFAASTPHYPTPSFQAGLEDNIKLIWKPAAARQPRALSRHIQHRARNRPTRNEMKCDATPLMPPLINHIRTLRLQRLKPRFVAARGQRSTSLVSWRAPKLPVRESPAGATGRALR